MNNNAISLTNHIGDDILNGPVSSALFQSPHVREEKYGLV